MKKQINEKLFNEIYEVVNIHTGDIARVTLEEETNLNEFFTCVSFFENDKTIEDLRRELKELNANVLEVLKKPQELLQEILGEDYTIQPTFSNKHFTEFIVVDNGIEFSFQITNSDYNVFNVVASGTFFANNSCVKYWNKFLDLCDQVRDLIFDLSHPNYE